MTKRGATGELVGDGEDIDITEGMARSPVLRRTGGTIRFSNPCSFSSPGAGLLQIDRKVARAAVGVDLDGAMPWSGADTAGSGTAGSGRPALKRRRVAGAASGSAVTRRGGDPVIESDAAARCFLRGTRIATLRGDVAVEALRIGDLVVTAADGALAVKWIGTRAYIARFIHEHNRAAVLPIRIARGALGASSPVRDLFVSPEHLMCLGDVLVRADRLLNGITVTRAETLDVVQYFHVELPRHAILYADGAPAESYRDTGNRNMFANVVEYLELGHDLDVPPLAPCLPVVAEGEALERVRAVIGARAAQAGLGTTDDPGLHLLVDGVALRPATEDGDTVRFAVPAGAREVRIISRSVVPADLDPASGDRRRLGVCLRGLSLHDGSGAREVAPGFAGLAAGFNDSEGGHRWTKGDATLPAELFAAMAGGFTLELALVRNGQQYPRPATADVPGFPAAGAVRVSA